MFTSCCPPFFQAFLLHVHGRFMRALQIYCACHAKACLTHTTASLVFAHLPQDDNVRFRLLRTRLLPWSLHMSRNFNDAVAVAAASVAVAVAAAAAAAAVLSCLH